jgi:rhodanese-related sulfurtransferase/uncharacterized membrane protein YedE/YeeE
MTAPLASHGLIGDGASLAVAFAIGIAFGWALERAGLGSARKLMGQFYLTDFTVFKVMFTAILTAMLGTFWLSRVGFLDLGAVYVPDTFLAPQLVGGIVFGIGFALAGLCPGTSCVAAATGRGDGMAVVAGMLSGVTLTGLAFHRLKAFYESGARGTFTLPDLLHVPYGVVVCGVVAVALTGFRLTSVIRRPPPGSPDLERASDIDLRRHAIMTVTALVFAISAAVVGNPSAVAATGHITPIELASWIKDRRPGLRVVDVRSPAAFDDYHVPTAEHQSRRALDAWPRTTDQVVVIYGDDDGQSADVVKSLHGRVQAFVLSGGVPAWIADVMSPTLATNASLQDQAVFAKTSELSRYFGGTPRTGVASTDPPAHAVRQLRRRGC